MFRDCMHSLLLSAICENDDRPRAGRTRRASSRLAHVGRTSTPPRIICEILTSLSAADFA